LYAVSQEKTTKVDDVPAKRIAEADGGANRQQNVAPADGNY